MRDYALKKTPKNMVKSTELLLLHVWGTHDQYHPFKFTINVVLSRMPATISFKTYLYQRDIKFPQKHISWSTWSLKSYLHRVFYFVVQVVYFCFNFGTSLGHSLVIKSIFEERLWCSLKLKTTHKFLFFPSL